MFLLNCLLAFFPSDVVILVVLSTGLHISKKLFSSKRMVLSLSLSIFPPDVQGTIELCVHEDLKIQKNY